VLIGAVLFILTFTIQAFAGDAPQWMHSLVGVSLPEHDEKTDAVLLDSETNVTVLSADKVKTRIREAYRILRPEGRELGTLHVYFDSHQKITYLHAWCIPAQGKDYDVNDKTAVDQSRQAIQGYELVSDARRRVLQIPAPDPGNIIGYEYEIEEDPLVLQDTWSFQQVNPVREARYSLQLPPGWEFRAAWLNYPEPKPSAAGNQWEWTVNNVNGVREEEDMPPMDGLVGQMVITFLPPGGPGQKGFSNWQQMGNWALNLTNGRRDASPEIREKVAELTKGAPSTLAKMKAIGNFVQDNIRYLEIALGNGWQPHAAAEVFGHRYGDCKDKANLMASMLHEIGVDSYYVYTNSVRGRVTSATPPHRVFNHAILPSK